MKDPVSNCCGAYMSTFDDYGLGRCPRCWEHCAVEWLEDNDDQTRKEEETMTKPKTIEIRLVCELSEGEVSDITEVHVEGRELRWQDLARRDVPWHTLQASAAGFYGLYCEGENRDSFEPTQEQREKWNVKHSK